MVEPRQAAKMLGVHENALRRWEEKGLLRAVRLPSPVRRFDPDKLGALRTGMHSGLPPAAHHDDLVAVNAISVDH